MMLNPGPAKKVTIHLNEDTAARNDFLYNEIFAFLLARGVAGATLVRPDADWVAPPRCSSHSGHAAERLPVRIYLFSPLKPSPA